MMETQLQERIRLLNTQQIAELRLFIEFLLSKPQLALLSEKKPNAFLEGLQRIAVPVNKVFINRAAIYEDRIW